MKYKKYLLILSFFVFSYSFGGEKQPTFCPADVGQQGEDLFKRECPAFIVNGEFIYWTIQEGALDYAVRMNRSFGGNTLTLPQGEVKTGKFDWDGGYRVSFGYFRAPNFWEGMGEYTYLHVAGKNSTNRPQGGNLFLNPTYPPIFTEPVSRAESSLYFHYELANLMASRVFLLHDNPHLRLRIFGGLTGTSFKQRWKIKYFRSDMAFTKVSNRWRYLAIGFRMGLSFDWFWGYDIYMTGKFSTSLVVGRYRNRARQEISRSFVAGSDSSVPIGNSLFKDYRFSFNNQFILGPSYQKSFSWGRAEIFAGYELTIWTNLQEVQRASLNAPQGAKQFWLNKGLVSLHGLTARLTLNF